MTSTQSVAALAAYVALYDSGARVWQADACGDFAAGPLPVLEPACCDVARLDAFGRFGWAWLDPTFTAARVAAQPTERTTT